MRQYNKPARMKAPAGEFVGNRLSKIYTRTGDDGTTGLGDGGRVEKDSARVEAYGTVDEANSTIGVVLATPNLPQEINECLVQVQSTRKSLIFVLI